MARTASVTRQAIEALIGEGLSQRQIADRLGKSHGSVRHWLRVYDLSTDPQSSRPRASFSSEHLGAEMEAACPIHGRTRFIWVPSGGRYRCKCCQTESVATFRKRTMNALLEAFGVSKCELCGYSRCRRSLHFHHVDPTQKLFSLNAAGMTTKFSKLLAEVAKCVLLCANCHGEVEDGIVSLPPSLVKRAAPHLMESLSGAKRSQGPIEARVTGR